MTIGTYGLWKFYIRKLMFGKYYDTYFEMYGEVTKSDDQVVTIIDCYDIEYRIVLTRLKSFEKQDKPNKL